MAKNTILASLPDFANNLGKFAENAAESKNLKSVAGNSKVYDGIQSAKRNTESMARITPGSERIGDSTNMLMGRNAAYQNEAKKALQQVDVELKGVNSRLQDARKIGGNTKDLEEAQAYLTKQRGQIYTDRAWNSVKHYGRMGKRLFDYSLREGDLVDRAKKTAIIGGAYMGANTLVRGATGGGYGHNNRGERDIAGIPFI